MMAKAFVRQPLFKWLADGSFLHVTVIYSASRNALLGWPQIGQT